MLGAGVAQVEATYPNAAEVVNSALEYINKLAEWLLGKTVQDYGKVKSNVIEYITQKCGKETGNKFALSLKGGEQVLSEKLAKVAPTDEQTHALKFVELKASVYFKLGKQFISLCISFH